MRVGVYRDSSQSANASSQPSQPDVLPASAGVTCSRQPDQQQFTSPKPFDSRIARSDTTREVKRALPVRQALRLVGWRVRGRRANCGLCKGHSIATVAFTERLWKCHRCGTGGSVFDLVMLAHKCDFLTALKFLAAEARVELPDRSKLSGAEQARLRHERKERQQQREHLDSACDEFAHLEWALRLECRCLIHFCDDAMAVPGEWTEEQWQLAARACELRNEYLLPEYALLSFAALGQRMEYVLANELGRMAMLMAVRRTGGVIDDSGRWVEVAA